MSSSVPVTLSTPPGFYKFLRQVVLRNAPGELRLIQCFALSGNNQSSWRSGTAHFIDIISFPRRSLVAAFPFDLLTLS